MGGSRLLDGTGSCTEVDERRPGWLPLLPWRGTGTVAASGPGCGCCSASCSPGRSGDDPGRAGGADRARRHRRPAGLQRRLRRRLPDRPRRVLDDTRYQRGSWFSREQSWSVDVPAGAPARRRGEARGRPAPAGRPGGAATGARGQPGVLRGPGRLVELPSGAALETDEHPSRYAPTIGYIGLFALGGGSFARGRESAPGADAASGQDPAVPMSSGPAWCGAGRDVRGAGPDVAGGARWVGLAGALVGAGLGGWAVVRSRRRAR